MKTFILHDESVNTQGFRMLTAGCNLEEFRKNPVMLLNHDSWSMPIGRWENIRLEGTKILADPVFDVEDPKGLEVKGKIDRDFVRAASIGSWAPEKVIMEMDSLTGREIPVAIKWTAREASIVTIGANHNALAFYDRQTGKLIENTDVIKLFDTADTIIIDTNMKELAKILELADTATEADIVASMQEVLSARTTAEAEVVRLTDELAAFHNAAKAAKTAEAVALVDAAVLDGRLDAKARENFLTLFDTDFDNANATLEAIPQRQAVAALIDHAKGQSATELADLQKLSWNELDKQGKLVTLKDKYPDIYAEKYQQRFGKNPKS
jgi:hypothetical protein